MQRSLLGRYKVYNFRNGLEFVNGIETLSFTNTDTLASLEKISIVIWFKGKSFALSSNASTQTNNRMWFAYDPDTLNKISATFRTTEQGSLVSGEAPTILTEVDPLTEATMFTAVYDGTQDVVEDRIKIYVNKNKLMGSAINVPTSLNSDILNNLVFQDLFANYQNEGVIGKIIVDVGYALTDAEISKLHSKRARPYEKVIGRNPYINCELDEEGSATTAINTGTSGFNGTLNNFTLPGSWVTF